jgi:hypothetical protein
MPEGMPYVVVRAVHPTWCTTQLPTEVADLLGVPVRESRGPERSSRELAFLRRDQATARVVSVPQAEDLLTAEMKEGRVLALAQMTEKMVFNLPERLLEHLEIRVYRRGPLGSRATDDTLAWIVPQRDYEQFRQASREGRPFGDRPGREYPRVYLCKSLFFRIRPDLEARKEVGALSPGTVRGRG